MKRFVKALSVFAAVLLLCLCLTACGGSKVGTVYEEQEVGFQLQLPAEGDTIAIMHTSMGDVYLRLFPEAAPKAVENFITLASQKYYDGLTFHRVIKDFMIQGGDPEGNGTGGKSIYTDNIDGTFEDEFDSKLLNLRGALAMANGGPNTNGSQFFINQMSAEGFGKRESYTEENIDVMYQNMYDSYVGYYGEQFTSVYGSWQDLKKVSHTETYIYKWIRDAVWDLYEQQGGNISLDGAWRKSGGHTVFGQVFKGLDVVDAIAAVATDENDKPETAVTIKNIEVTTFKTEMVTSTETAK